MDAIRSGGSGWARAQSRSSLQREENVGSQVLISGTRLLKESRKGQDHGAGHGGVSTMRAQKVDGDFIAGAAGRMGGRTQSLVGPLAFWSARLEGSQGAGRGGLVGDRAGRTSNSQMLLDETDSQKRSTARGEEGQRMREAIGEAVLSQASKRDDADIHHQNRMSELVFFRSSELAGGEGQGSCDGGTPKCRRAERRGSHHDCREFPFSKTCI